MTKKCTALTLILIGLSLCAPAQDSTTDSLKAILSAGGDPAYMAYIAQEITVTYFDTDPDSAIIYGQRALARSATVDDPAVHAQSMMDLVVCYIAATQPDRARDMLEESLPFFIKNDLHKKVGAYYRNMAVVGELTNEPDTSLKYLNLCMEHLKIHPDEYLEAETEFSLAYAYQEKGYLQLATQHALESARYFESIESHDDLAYVYQYLGVIADLNGQTEDAIAWEEKAITNGIIAENSRNLAHSYHNLAQYHEQIDNWTDTKSNYQKAYDLSLETSQPHAAMRNALSLSYVYYHYDQRDSCELWMIRSERSAREFGDDYTLGEIMRLRAQIALDDRDRSAAARYIGVSRSHYPSRSRPIELANAHEKEAEILERMSDYKESIAHMRAAKEIRDSLFSLRQTQQIAEMNLIYKTEKKDAEIRVLSKQAELDALRKKGLGAGLVLLTLLGASIIYSQIQRRRREQIQYQSEKKIEVERRRHAEEQLDYKKKELTAKVLQLASKNEFLQSLEQEISQMRSSVDESVSSASRRISRMIHSDTLDDEEWTQFGREFSSVHQDFMDRMKAEHGDFTKNEWRLIALLKMNLSSKEIATILRISDEGVKKARYRLRKKLGLESATDIQDYLIGY